MPRSPARRSSVARAVGQRARRSSAAIRRRPTAAGAARPWPSARRPGHAPRPGGRAAGRRRPSPDGARRRAARSPRPQAVAGQLLVGDHDRRALVGEVAGVVALVRAGERIRHQDRGARRPRRPRRRSTSRPGRARGRRPRAHRPCGRSGTARPRSADASSSGSAWRAAPASAMPSSPARCRTCQSASSRGSASATARVQARHRLRPAEDEQQAIVAGRGRTRAAPRRDRSRRTSESACRTRSCCRGRPRGSAGS